jgi:hypothetical protein
MLEAQTLLSNGSATSAAVTLHGGAYNIHILGTLATTTKLQTLGPDNTTWLDCGSNITAAGVVSYAQLAPGQYRLSLSGGSPAGIYANIVGIPLY